MFDVKLCKIVNCRHVVYVGCAFENTLVTKRSAAEFSVLFIQSKDPSLNTRSAPKPRVNDGLKMRASVRMTRYLESWGAVKPFAHLQSPEGFTTDTIGNGKPHCKVRTCRRWATLSCRITDIEFLCGQSILVYNSISYTSDCNL